MLRTDPRDLISALHAPLGQFPRDEAVSNRLARQPEAARDQQQRRRAPSGNPAQTLTAPVQPLCCTRL
ncbi:hypothetical protein [Sphingobium sp. B11D3D]|uniref:hypothetical protein n=1 Tax=Sphingobium sp. B11D3D TaxID=2940576 RepID=UPI002223FA33|nr:hypothetical protein [Sphingobium sp. B11D3D]